MQEAALLDALRRGRIAGAALDVHYAYPLPPEHPLWEMPNVMITSHTAGLSGDAFRHSLTVALADTIAVARGLPPANPVPEMGPDISNVGAHIRQTGRAAREGSISP